MTEFIAITSILGALLIGAMSPGPSFVLVVQTSITSTRRTGVAMALGLGVGSALFGIIALLGLQAILQNVTWAYFIFKIAGGCYLLYLAYKIWQGSNTSLEVNCPNTSSSKSYVKAFLLGLITQISNPKTAVVFASVFATFITDSFQIFHSIILLSLIFLMETVWYSIIATAFSSQKPRSIYLNAKKYIDRSAAAIIGFMGIKLILSK